MRTSWNGEYLKLRMCFSKIENDYSSNFDFHIVRAGAHGVFPSALIEKNNK